MKKLFIAAILLALSVQANAKNFISGTAEFYAYRDAVLIQLEEKTYSERQLTCLRTVDVSWIIGVASEVTVSEGSQPLLTFKSYIQPDSYVHQEKSLFAVSIYTTGDFKKIMAAQLVIYNAGKVNSGTLLNPKVENGYIEAVKCGRSY